MTDKLWKEKQKIEAEIDALQERKRLLSQQISEAEEALKPSPAGNVQTIHIKASDLPPELRAEEE